MPLFTLYSDAYLAYDFGPGHPFTPVRQRMLADLLAAHGVDPATFVAAPQATRADVRTVHDEAFVRAVEAASSGHALPDAWSFGLGTGDVPAFAGMDAATRTLVGGTLEAARRIASGEARRALTLGGGLHHAHPGHASGFCVYNDHAVAIRHLRAQGLRVAYLDVDVHHGDGVEAAFYDDPDVLTISLHESGATLFPGTGFASDRGTGAGEGFAVNVPLALGTADESYLDTFDAVVLPLLRAFRPDVLCVEAGADAHRFDPLAHLALSTHAFEAVFRRIVALADELTGGRLLVTLGGGYHLDAAPRIWTILYHVLADRPLPEALPATYLDAWQPRLPLRLTPTLHDAEAPRPSAPGAAEANRRAVEATMAGRAWTT